MQRPMPDIGDIPGEQLIRFTPTGAIIVEHLTDCELAAAELAATSPGWLVADPIGRIGDHQMGLASGQHLRDIRRASAVAAANPVLPQLPYVPEPGHRMRRDFRNAIGVS